MIKIVNKSENEIVCEISGDICSNLYESFRDSREELTIPKDIKEILSNNNKTRIIFNINSNGGDVFSGTAISNMIKAYKGETIANIQSIGASIASVIAMSCDKIRMPKNAYLMIHKPCVAKMYGDSFELRKTADLLDKIQDNIIDVYMQKVLDGVDRTTIENLVNNETWFNGVEASKYFDIELLEELKVLNFSSGITHKNQPISNKIEIPKELIEEIENLKKY